MVEEASSLQIQDMHRCRRRRDQGVRVRQGLRDGDQLLNVSKLPFGDPITRQAVAFAGDAEEVNDIRNGGLNTIASGPFPPDNPAHLDEIPDTHNVKKAKQLAAGVPAEAR